MPSLVGHLMSEIWSLDTAVKSDGPTSLDERGQGAHLTARHAV